MVKKKRLQNCNKKFIVIVSVLIVLALTFSIVTSHVQRNKESEVNSLVIYHWWPSVGEQVAFNALLDLFIERNPETLIISAPLQGESANKLRRAKELIEPLIVADEAPDILQLHTGYGTKEYYDAGLLEPVTSSWEDANLDSTTPLMIKFMCKFDDDYYCLPMNVHRTNVVWYNKHVLDDAKINSNEIKTWDDFFSACDKIRNSGIEYPVQIAEAWTVQHTFDQIIASVGIDFYEDWINGNISSVSDERLLEAFDIFEKYISYANLDSALIGWDVAAKRIIDGESAFYVMGDWVNAEFVVEEKIYDVDYGTFMVPETENMYGLVMDAFQISRNSKHITNAKKWIDIVASGEGQDVFNPLKGSIPIRRDAVVNKYGSYQKSAIYDFGVTDIMYPALSSGAPKSFELAMQNILAEYVLDMNKDAAIEKIVAQINDTKDEYVIEWNLD